MIRVVHPGSDPDFLPIQDAGSRGQKGTGYRIPDPDPQDRFIGCLNISLISCILWRRHIRHNQTVRRAVEYCTIYLNPHVGGNGYNTCVCIACMRNVYIGMPRSGRSPSKVVSCTFLLHELPAEGCLYNLVIIFRRKLGIGVESFF